MLDLWYYELMNEFKAPGSIEPQTKNRQTEMAEQIKTLAKILIKEKRDMGLQKEIYEFGKRFKEKHGDVPPYRLYHTLVGSTVSEDEEASFPLDTQDGEVMKFIKDASERYH